MFKEFPEWNSLDASALDDLLNVFSLDSLKSSHPVSVPIEHPREISQIFDAISYDKGERNRTARAEPGCKHSLPLCFNLFQTSAASKQFRQFLKN